MDLKEEELDGIDDDDLDVGSKVIYLPYMARVSDYRKVPDGPTPHGHTIIRERVTSRGYDHTTVGIEVSSILVIEDQMTRPSQSWSNAPETLATKLMTPTRKWTKCGLLLRELSDKLRK